jgi:hypothetical protein
MTVRVNPTGEAIIETVELPYDDRHLEFVGMSCGQMSEDPVLWLRAAVAQDTNRPTSHVADRELMARLGYEGYLYWEPLVIDALVRYLGFQIRTELPDAELVSTAQM